MLQGDLTALQAASHEGHDEIVKVLIEAKADLNLLTHVSDRLNLLFYTIIMYNLNH